MTAQILDLDSLRPHITGPGSCSHCGHTCELVFPELAKGKPLECSACGLMNMELTSTFFGYEEGTALLNCSECKEVQFQIAQDNILCINCGHRGEHPF